MSRIHSTTDYSKFHFSTMNKMDGVNAGHVKKLVSSIKICNLLDIRPIIVSSDYMVIDGQHRLKAAEHLRVPIFYCIDDTYEPEHIKNLQIQRTWGPRDYINFYAHKNNEHYKFIKELLLDTGLSAYAICNIICQANTYKSKPLNNGRALVDLDRKEHYRQKLKTIKEIVHFLKYETNLKTKRFVTGTYFIIALYRILTDPKIDEDKIITKIKKHWDVLRPMDTADDYVHLLKSKVYNRYDKK